VAVQPTYRQRGGRLLFATLRSDVGSRHETRARVWGVAALLLLLAGPVHAQSINRGTLEGMVWDTAGAGFNDARVQITHVATGVSRLLSTDRGGRFRFPLLPPGDYDVFVEQLGYQPVHVVAVPVRPARTQTVSVTLAPVELPVNEVEVRPFTGPVQDSRAGASQWYAPFEISGLPDTRREVTELGRYSTVSNERLDTERLPGWLSGTAFDGIPYASAQHYDLAPSAFGAAAFPLSGISNAELFTNPVDVEWSEYAGGYLSGYTRQGTDQPEVRFFADWLGGNLTSSDYFGTQNVSANSFRGGAAVSGPIVRDTAHYVIGFELQSLLTPLPPAWAIDTFNSGLVSVADSFGVNIRPYTETLVQASKLGTAYGRFDWQITQNHDVSIRGSLAALSLGGSDGHPYDPGLGPDFVASLGADIDGLDASGGAAVTSRFSNVVANEFRVGVDRSDRDYGLTSPPATRIVNGGLAFGVDPTLPAEFKRFAMRGSETLHFLFGQHRLKAGVSGVFTSYQQRYTFGAAGEFAFAGVSEFANLQGSFGQATGSAPFAKFQNWQVAGYIQDLWTAAPGLNVLLGLRFEYEELDRGAVSPNPQWFALTGIANSDFNWVQRKWSPRFSVLWDISQRGEWLVSGTAGFYHNLVPAGSFGELVTQDGSIDDRSGVGDLDSWPVAPGLGAAPVVGPRLTVLGPKYGPPRTGRASVGLSRLFDDRTAVHLSGAYRYTDFLPRRKDINLAQAPSGQDQYGRPIYGRLVQEGSLLAVQPRTNRRFPNFGLVSSLDTDGVSKYWGVTATLERHASDWLDLLVAYTFSWGEDNWLGASGGGPGVQLTPFPSGISGFDWAQGKPDSDIPDRVVIGAQAKVPGLLAGARVSAFYSYQSGLPFTPGFRAGVDANGDGSARNDPAYVDPSVAGMDQLLGEWECLAEQANRFAGRNTCRGPNTTRLDARFAVGLYAVQGMPIELVVDFLNILDTDLGPRDNALFLVDGSRPLETSPDGTVFVPLVTNPNFGRALVHYSTGRSLRFGIRMGL